MPDALLQTYERWYRAGRPAQVGSRWNRTAWSRQLPQYTDFFESLGPDGLNRVQAVEKSPAVVDHQTAVQVFLLAMVWGHGSVGYGPFRTRRILERPEVASELLEVAEIAYRGGGLEAFAHVASRRRESGTFLKWLGPAFGTKYIYFLTAQDTTQQPAPVMDAVVRRWFGVHVPDRPLKVGIWDVLSYRTFLESLTEWAEEIRERFGHHVRLDDVEYMIFAEGYLFEDEGEWRESWESEQSQLAPTLLIDQLKALAVGSADPRRASALIAELESLLEPLEDDVRSYG